MRDGDARAVSRGKPAPTFAPWTLLLVIFTKIARSFEKQPLTYEQAQACPLPAMQMQHFLLAKLRTGGDTSGREREAEYASDGA